MTKRSQSMFLNDIEANREKLTAEIQGKSVCVIGGAGSIGSSFIRAVLPFKPSKLIVIDLNETDWQSSQETCAAPTECMSRRNSVSIH